MQLREAIMPLVKEFSVKVIVRQSILVTSLLACSGAFAADSKPIIQAEARQEKVSSMKVTVTNLRRSYDFYTKVIGLKDVALPLPKPVFDDPEVPFTQACLNFSGSRADPFLCLIKAKGSVPSREHANLTWLGFTTDVHATVARVKELGLQVVFEPTPFKGAVVSGVRDPDGYGIELAEGTLSDQ
jgi:predicted enzyme related to lactoylglutathione lyase